MTALTSASNMLRSPLSDINMTDHFNLPSAMTEGRLCGTAKPVRLLTSSDRLAMFQLMSTYFENIRWQRFSQDLEEKEWVILLHERGNGQLRGLSTLMRMDDELDGEPFMAFYSGDTVICREFWGETILPRLWSRLVFNLAEGINDRKVFWFLICSGYKTYRFLPVFFKAFYPSFAHSSPEHVRRIMHRLALRKFPNEYDAASGVVRFREATPLKAGVAEITDLRLRDPHVAFFKRVNPKHVLGDELVCLTVVDYSNLTKAGRRMVGLKNGEGG